MPKTFEQELEDLADGIVTGKIFGAEETNATETIVQPATAPAAAGGALTLDSDGAQRRRHAKPAPGNPAPRPAADRNEPGDEPDPAPGTGQPPAAA